MLTFLHLGQRRQPQGGQSRAGPQPHVIFREVKLIALGVDDDRHTAGDAFRLRLCGQTFGAAYAHKPDPARAACELPTLRHCDGGANARVGARAKPNRQAFDLFPLKVGLAQRLFNQTQRMSGALPGLHHFAQRRWRGGAAARGFPTASRLHDRDAPLRRRKLKRQNLHR